MPNSTALTVAVSGEPVTCTPVQPQLGTSPATWRDLTKPYSEAVTLGCNVRRTPSGSLKSTLRVTFPTTLPEISSGCCDTRTPKDISVAISIIAPDYVDSQLIEDAVMASMVLSTDANVLESIKNSIPLSI